LRARAAESAELPWRELACNFAVYVRSAVVQISLALDFASHELSAAYVMEQLAHGGVSGDGPFIIGEYVPY
jgi:hypothetical protein